MNNLLKIIFLFLTAAIICSCGSVNKIHPPQTMPYKTDGILFDFQADSLLNLYQNRPHALVVCAYQLKDINSFNQLSEGKEGLSKLLDCNRFDNSAIFAKRYVVQPARTMKASMDRFEGTEHVGIVAGYYKLNKISVTRTYRIPVGGFLFFRGPRVLLVELELGPQEIKEKVAQN